MNVIKRLKCKISEELLTYRCKEASKMTEEEINDTSALFSENYGLWSKASPKGGHPIRFTPQMIRTSFVEKENRFVAMVYYEEKLVGHVFYMRKNIPHKGNITWILQLVVKKEYRGHSIGTKLMHSIWQLSDSYAWGLYTSNPKTIRALENATMREVDVSIINRRFKKIAPDISDLLSDKKWVDSYTPGIVNTNFYVDHGDLQSRIEQAYPDRDFPLNKKLPEGHEWLAVVFSDQVPTLTRLDTYLEYSNSVLVQAYSRMNMNSHTWSRHTDQEVEFIQSYLNNNDVVLDVGCGTGRLTNGLAKCGIRVHGIDFSHDLLQIAKSSIQNKASFEYADARRFYSRFKYSAALCMYDVIGSFPNEKDNIRILERIFRCLKPGSVIILSVMNMELTKSRCQKKKHVVSDIHKNIDCLLRLKGSNTMQSTGDIFDGQYIIVDDSTGICYRKEQFFSEDDLPIEYLIRDRRYTKKGIQAIVQKAGFHIEDCYFFQAGRLNDLHLRSTDSRSKEILVIARKPTRGRLSTIKSAWK